MCTVDSGILYGWCGRLYVSELNNEHFTRQIIILKQFFEWLSLTWQFASITSSTWRCLNIDISQGSVATYLRCGGIFKYDFVANFLQSLTVKEFRKSVNILGSYGQEFNVLFFCLTVYKCEQQ